MLRLLRSTIFLIVACALATVSARLLGGTRPSPFVSVFTGPDGSTCDQPCLFGIRPGQTTTKAAVALLTMHPLTRGLTVLSSTPVLMGDPQNGVFIDVETTPDGLVQAVTLSLGISPGNEPASRPNPWTAPLSLGDALPEGSPSTTFSVHGGNEQIIFSRAKLGLIVQVRSGQRFEIDTRVNAIILFSLPPCGDNPASITATLWQGFASQERYNHAPTIELPLTLAGRITSSSPLILCQQE